MMETYNPTQVLPFKLDVQRCAQCGNDHYSMEIKNLTFTLDEGLDKYFVCPFTQKPVYVKIIQG